MSDREKVINEQQRQIEELEERIAIMGEQMETIPDKEGCTPDLEGGGMTWYFCCGECRTSINPQDHFCRNCGRKVKWSE